jgi:hypothetical protein
MMTKENRRFIKVDLLAETFKINLESFFLRASTPLSLLAKKMLSYANSKWKYIEIQGDRAYHYKYHRAHLDLPFVAVNLTTLQCKEKIKGLIGSPCRIPTDGTTGSVN